MLHCGKIMENVKSVSRKMTAWLYHSFLICPHHVFHCFSFTINLLSSVNSAEHLQMTRVRKASLTNSPGVRVGVCARRGANAQQNGHLLVTFFHARRSQGHVYQLLIVVSILPLAPIFPYPPFHGYRFSKIKSSFLGSVPQGSLAPLKSCLGLPYLGSLFGFLIQVPYLGSVFRFLIQVPYFGSLFRFLIWVPYLSSLFWFLIQVPYLVA